MRRSNSSRISSLARACTSAKEGTNGLRAPSREDVRGDVRLFAPPQTEPEKYNLYAGLANLANQLTVMHADLSQLRNEVERLKGR